MSQRLTAAERAYRTHLYATAEGISIRDVDVSDVLRLCRTFYEAHGGRGLVDLITEWLCAVDSIVPVTHEASSVSTLRDMTGAVAFSRVYRDEDGAQERLLAAAVRQSASIARTTGVTPHEAFSDYMASADIFRAHFREWMDIMQEGLRAAHHHRDRLPVRGIIRASRPVREQDMNFLLNGAAFTGWFASPFLQAAAEVGVPLRRVDNDLLIPPATIPSRILSTLEIRIHE